MKLFSRMKTALYNLRFKIVMGVCCTSVCLATANTNVAREFTNLPTQSIITGSVKGTDGLPILGANILEKGTVNGTQTDFDGNFNITVGADAILVISYIGFANQEIRVGARTSIDVVLEESVSSLDEVVVVGYGSVKKSDITGSVVRADLKAFEAQPNTSIIQSLQGSLPGLNVGAVNSAGAAPSITVRGQNTLSGSTAPLIVLDGIIYNGNLTDLNPNDIASIDVLRDASSKAIYGSYAANGVLIVTSKKGKKGTKPEFNYSTFYSIQSPTKVFTPLDRDGFIQKTRDQFYEEAYLAPDFTQLNPAFDPLSRITDLNATEGFANGTDFNWLEPITQSGFIVNHNLSMAGSTDKLNYFISGSYTGQEGYIKGDQYERISLRANFDNKINDWMTVGLQSFVTSADYSGRAPDIRLLELLTPLNVPRDESGELIEFPNQSVRNPLYALLNDDLDKRLNLFAKIYTKIDVPFIKGLSYTLNYSTNYRTTRQYGFDPFAQNNTGAGFKNNDVFQDYTLDNILTYKKTIAEDHTIDITALSGQQRLWGDGTDASAAIFLNDALGFNALEAGDIAQRGVSSSAYEEYSVYQMGRLFYGYKSKYLFTGTVRRDGFSGFGTNRKFGIFPSAAVAWVASKEGFFEDALPVFNNLKFRASYGVSGNRTLGRYGTLSRVNTGFVTNFDDQSAFGQSIGNLANNNLGWETTTGLNLGLDFGLFKGRINGSVDYYIDKTEDILFSVNLPRITGFGSVLSNIGEIENRGVNLTLNTVNIQSKDFVWESTFNFSANRNEIVSILGNDEDGDGVEDDLIGNGLFIGEQRGAIFNFGTDGIYQLGDEIPDGYRAGNYIVSDISGPDGVPDGLITAVDDRSILGFVEPAYSFSIFNSFTYKDLSLSFFINSIQGGSDGYFGNITPREGSWNPQSELNRFKEEDYWTPTNTDARFQGISSVGAVSPQQYQQRSFIRLQDLSLGYNLNKVADRIGFKSASVNISGKNLVTITDWVGSDPELNLGLGTGFLPLQRSISLGLNVTF